MDNSQMKAGRFLKIQTGKRLYNRIISHVKAGGGVLICTHLKTTIITAKYADSIKLDKFGSLYMQRGKRWDCIDFCGFKFSR